MTAPPTDAVRVRPYAGDAEHLADELRRLDLLIRLRLATVDLRNEARPQEQTARAVYVTRDEVDWLLSPAGDRPEPASAGPIADFAALELLSADIDTRVRRSAADGVRLALPALGRLLGLSPDELLAVVVCLAPELRRKYDRLYAYLQDDITRRRPSVDLVLELLYPTERERWAARALLSGGGTLLRAGVLRTVDDPLSPSGSSALAEFLALDPGICQYLTGVAALDPRLVGKAALCLPAADSPGGLAAGPAADLAADLAAGLVRLADHHLRQGRPLVCYLRGPAGVGKADLAARVSAELGRPLVSLDAAALARSAEGERLLRLAFRDALLRDGAVHLAGADGLAGPDAGSLRAALAEAVADFGGLAFLTAEAGQAPATSIGGAAVHLVDVPLPDPAESAALWRHTLSGHAVDPDGWAAELAAAYRLPAGRIRAALAAADHRRLTAPEPRPLTMADLYAACRDLSDQDLGTLARKVRPRAGWDDLVLPPERLSRLRDIRGQVRYHHHVYGTWGMGGKVSHGTGLSVLFSGPPGTGKTMAAEVLAVDLGRDLYKVDLSGVVSKYIGETEKNLDRIFTAARDGNAILFFDEADALFGKRTEVSDAHDRYANIETSYLLQKVEEHEGLVVLATNLRQNMDDAFTRRLRFIVEFPFPDAASRERIWRGMFPPRVPLAPDVDFAELAAAYPVAGANIRNIALNAAFLAAAAGGAVDRARLDRGARQEFENLGKLWPGPAGEKGSPR
ncbi:MAG: AAA family ATPase [Mycobacteriales bacterium]